MCVERCDLFFAKPHPPPSGACCTLWLASRLPSHACFVRKRLLTSKPLIPSPSPSISSLPPLPARPPLPPLRMDFGVCPSDTLRYALCSDDTGSGVLGEDGKYAVSGERMIGEEIAIGPRGGGAFFGILGQAMLSGTAPCFTATRTRRYYQSVKGMHGLSTACKKRPGSSSWQQRATVRRASLPDASYDETEQEVVNISSEISVRRHIFKHGCSMGWGGPDVGA